ncbi:MAG TPA: DUF3784 domain-containing protein [Candidatus Saccharimonadales bacterium]|nr:DUF3784 domain-containing protein [Candidatus Saccharimonadales bacterium]
MKSCSYCGRENLDNATSCCECGTDEFVAPTPPPTKEHLDVAVEQAIGTSNEIVAERNAASRAARELEYLKTDLSADHYLLTSTDQELVEILAHPTDWCGYDVAHARQLAVQRGIDLGQVAAKKTEHLQQLRRGQHASKQLIIFGWIFSFLGGVVGLGIAWTLASMKEKTPHGEFFTYDEESRAIGRAMLKFAVVMFGIGVFLRVASTLSR